MGRPKKEYTYSLDRVEFDSFESVMCDVSDQFEPGETVKIYKGEIKSLKHSDFIDVYTIIDQMQERAYSDVGDLAEDYLLDVQKDKIDSLKKTLSRWFDKNCAQPKFYTVLNVKEIKIVVGV